MTGMNWEHGAILAGLTLIFSGLSVSLFQHRDLKFNS